MLALLKPYPAPLALALFCLVAGAGLDAVRPLFIMAVVDRVIVGGEAGLLMPLITGIVAVSLAHGLATFGLTYLRRYLGERVVYDLRNRLYAHLQRLDAPFYDRFRTGELMSRAGSDVQAIRHMMGFGIFILLRIAVSTALVLAAALTLSPSLTGMALLAIPGLYWTVRRFHTQIKPAARRIQERTARLSAAVQENVAGIRVVRAFGQERQEEAKFERVNRENLEAHLAAAEIRARYGPLMDLWGLVVRAVLLLAGGWLVIRGHVTIGVLVAMDGYVARLIQPIQHIHHLVDMTSEGLASGERVFELLDTRPGITDPGPSPAAPARLGPKTDPDKRGRIDFQGVWLRYGGESRDSPEPRGDGGADDGPWALRDVNLTVEPGETVLLMGPTGAGKTSLLRLVNRTYDPTRGRVCLDGVDVREHPLTLLRRRVALIPQEAFLFSTTVHHNIAYGRPDASREEVEEAARRARAHEFIVRLPEGYDTRVGERGARLSGGQKQRIAIARALLADPEVLLIDDAASALDTDTEARLWEDLADVLAERTVIIVTQRPIRLGHPARLVIMEGGRIVAQGDPEQLAAAEGFYARILGLQARGEVESARGVRPG